MGHCRTRKIQINCQNILQRCDRSNNSFRLNKVISTLKSNIRKKYKISSSIESFHSVETWIKDARELARMDISILVCGNKSDLYEMRTVEESEVERFCKGQKVQYIETSALDGSNVKESF